MLCDIESAIAKMIINYIDVLDALEVERLMTQKVLFVKISGC